MSKKQKKINKEEQEKNWAQTAEIFEGKEGLSVMKASRVLNAIERRKLLGRGKSKLISLRLPEEDIQVLREIAEKNDRKYQQLIIHAIERFLEDYWFVQKRLKRLD
jgi:predicted DNA-binding protein